MPIKKFDQKFGLGFIDSLPSKAGVYRFIGEEGEILYVGKSKNLKSRLRGYRNPTRKKKDKKKHLIVQNSLKIEYTVCDDEKRALLLENELIQKLTPRFNTAGAYSFLYPMIGFKRAREHLVLCYTTSEDSFAADFNIFGVFRSRVVTKDAYLALKEVFSILGHAEKRVSLKGYPKVRFSSLSGFRQIDEDFDRKLSDFLLGKSDKFLEFITLRLLEKLSARSRASEVAESLETLSYFYSSEACRLREALNRTNQSKLRFVSQKERDALFIRASG